MAQKDDIQRLINENQRRLQKLKEQAARFGINTPPHISLEIEDIETEVARLQLQLEQASETPSDISTQPTTAAGKPGAGPVYNIGSIQAGQVNIDSNQQIGNQTIDMDFSETHVPEGATVVQGDQLQFSGNFQGAMVNVKSTLENVSQTINNAPRIDQADRVKLQELLVQLNAALQQVPADKTEEAETVAKLAADLVETATEEKPNKSTAQFRASSLQLAAESLDKMQPDVLPLATQIAAQVASLLG